MNNKLTDRGYLIFPKVVPDHLLQAVIDDIHAHTGGGKDTQSSYGGMVEMYHYQSMWDVRQHPAVHEVFAGLFGTGRLWVSIDRVCLKKPVPDGYEALVGGGFIHWDINANQRPRPFAVQGLVALTDTDENMGGFQCLPALYKQLDEFKEASPAKKIPYPNFGIDRFFAVLGREEDIWPIEKVPMKAGDLLVWDSFLPHGNGPNFGKAPRMAQYVTMTLPGDERLRQERIDCWRGNLPPSDWAFPGDPRGVEQDRSLPAYLTELGGKLLGLEDW